ncbi:MAG: prephenate dehydratase [Candidatus Omnitrophica bacterium]|nr:prephenate dehydratase [Candidatus Omnitrophota bacterium]
MSTIAYLGPEKTNTHFAAQKKFGRRCRYLHAPTVEDVFRLVERRKAEYGVVPIENSLEGAVTHTLDRFIDFKDSPAKICGEIELPIQHYLIIHPGAAVGKIRVVYSHPQALAQCRPWLVKNCSGANYRERDSTAEAVKELFNKEEKSWGLNERGAIGRSELAKEHRLKTVPIPHDQENKTRFLIISLKATRPGKRNKTSLMFALKDRPGALHDTLVPFKRCGINLTKIESRPSKRKAWEYLFFIDLEGHESEPRVQKALKGLGESTSDLRILGSYPIQRG